MTCEIRRANRDDYPALLELIKDLAAFENAPEKVTNSVDQMIDEEEHFEAIVACDGEKVIGMALYFFAYYTWVGKSLYLDDLYVKDTYRGQGVGTLLMNEIFRIGRDRQCHRLRWQVLSWNQNAINLYKKVGATIVDGWYNCDLLSNNMPTA